MTTLIAFLPSENAQPPFQTVLTMDGDSYTGTAMWNIAAQRWYLRIDDLSGNMVWNGPILGSPDNYDIYLAPGIFTTSTILYRTGTGNFEVNP